MHLLHSQRTDGGDKAGLARAVPYRMQGADEDGARNIRRYGRSGGEVGQPNPLVTHNWRLCVWYRQ